ECGKRRGCRKAPFVGGVRAWDPLCANDPMGVCRTTPDRAGAGTRRCAQYPEVVLDGLLLAPRAR
ncbi:MAG: hypothetical protein ACE10G_05560, partial [Gemmatimonadales bacterium]